MQLPVVQQLLRDLQTCFVEASMAHEFVVMRNGVIETYEDYDKIPHDFQHVIKFVPELSDHHDHDESHIWAEKLQTLMAIEKNNSKVA